MKQRKLIRGLVKSVGVLACGITMAYAASLPATININEANAKALAKGLQGVGPKRAGAIVEYRRQHGRFTSYKDLSKIRGLGPKFISRYEDDLKKRVKTG